MNAFLIFCKRHRSVVKQKYPHLENRSITKILGEWWAGLDSEEKQKYTELARTYKEAFMRANPHFKWYKTDIR
jgi:SOX transcription factor, putative